MELSSSIEGRDLADIQRKCTNDRMGRKSWEAFPSFSSLKLPEMLAYIVTVYVCVFTRRHQVMRGQVWGRSCLPFCVIAVVQLQMLRNGCRQCVLHKSYKSSGEALGALSNTTPVWRACELLSTLSFVLLIFFLPLRGFVVP